MNGETTYVKISGRINNLRQNRLSDSFVLTSTDRAWGSLGAVAAAFAGNGGAAMMTASHMADTDEEADLLEFDIDGKNFNGWVWRCPFEEGDVVDVIASHGGNVQNFIAICRPGDQIIALFPHCSRGTRCHVLNALKWWGISTAFFAFVLALAPLFWSGISKLLELIPEISIVLTGVSVYCGISICLIARKWMPFVRRAEAAFRALGWAAPSRIDLKKLAKENRRANDHPEYGVFYFRYDSSVYSAPQSSA